MSPGYRMRPARGSGLLPTMPVWKLTRTPLARRAFEALDDLGVTAARLEELRRPLTEPLPGYELPEHVSLRVDSGPERALGEHADRPELADTDRVVSAVAETPAGERVVGVQPIATAGSVRVAPLDRRVDFDGAYCWGLYVDPDWRRRGIATALVARAFEDVAERSEQSSVHVLVGADNVPSRRLVESLGFERERVRSYCRAFGVERRRQSTS